MYQANITLNELQDLKSDFELLKTEELSIHFGGLKAVDGVSFDLIHREILGIIGPNGAGKTTLFNLFSGVYAPLSGRIFFEGKAIHGLKPNLINERGIARTFQNIRLFSDLSVLDNIRIVMQHRADYGLRHLLFNTEKYRMQEDEILRKSREFLKIFGLEIKHDITAKNLSYGEQKRLEIARALATEPKLLLLDEPAAGMNTAEKEGQIELIKWIMLNFDISIILIDHDMPFVMNLCPRIIVLDYGKIISMGPPGKIKKDPEVIKAYLGEESHA